MNAEEIRVRIKEIIANVTNLDPEEIADDASVEDLDLDSLSGLEIGVDIDYEFKLGVQEERLGELRTLQDAVELVQERVAAKYGSSRAGDAGPKAARDAADRQEDRRAGGDRRRSEKGIRNIFPFSLFSTVEAARTDAKSSAAIRPQARYTRRR